MSIWTNIAILYWHLTDHIRCCAQRACYEIVGRACGDRWSTGTSTDNHGQRVTYNIYIYRQFVKQAIQIDPYIHWHPFVLKTQGLNDLKVNNRIGKFSVLRNSTKWKCITLRWQTLFITSIPQGMLILLINVTVLYWDNTAEPRP